MAAKCIIGGAVFRSELTGAAKTAAAIFASIVTGITAVHKHC